MLACYYLQGKQLASGVIGLLTCQSHYNVSGINRTPPARLLLRHPLDQRILKRNLCYSDFTESDIGNAPPNTGNASPTLTALSEPSPSTSERLSCTYSFF